MKKNTLLILGLFICSTINAQTFTPQTYNPALWLDASDASTITETASLVSAWNDKSGNGNHVTQSTTANQPTFVSITDGIEFDGTTSLLIGNNTLVYGADTTLTLFVVAKPDDNSAKGSVIAKGEFTSGSDYRIELGHNGYDVCIQGAREWNSSSNSWDIAYQNMFRTYFNSDKQVGYYLNGQRVELPHRDVSYSPNTSPFCIGGRSNYYNFFDGTVQEILLFQEELTVCEMEHIEGYLAHKWNMDVYMISNHSFKNNDFGICSEIELSVDENAANTTIIGTLSGLYSGSAVTFSDWKIEDDGLFENMFALSNTGILTVNDNTNLDYEKTSAFNIEVSASANGTRVYGGVNINLNDLADGGTAKTNSELWGVNGEKWNPRGRLPDFSYVGYKSGEESYHYVNTIVDVTTFGAINNDSISDVVAIQNAINSIDSGIVYFPAGLYVIDDYININKDNIVLRGAGSDTITGTQFYMPKSADELGNSADYIIGFNGALAGPSHSLTESTKMGDRSVTLSNVNGLDVGEYITLGYTGTHLHNEELWNHILNNQNADWQCSVHWSNGDDGLMMFHTIERIEGNIVTLKEPIRLDLNLDWSPQLVRRTDWFLKNCGVEDIYIACKYIPEPAHLQEPGYNPIYFGKTINCWVNNVAINNADNGLRFDFSGFAEIKNITFYGRAGHHGWTFAYSSHCLADDIYFYNWAEWIHSFTLTHKANGNVISDVSGISGIAISSDFHRNTPWETLITNVDNDWNYNSSGVWCAGPNAGKRTVYWNMGGSGFTYFPFWDDYQTTLVGDMHIAEKFHPEKGWHENVPNNTVTNLHTAQFNRRINLPTDPLFTADATLGDRLNYWERDPSRWEIENGAYQLYFSELSSLTGNRLGEYTIHDNIFATDMVITADTRSLEKININASADAALVANYQDDNNYYFAVISANSSESGIYKVESGTATLLKSMNLTLSNAFQTFSFERSGTDLKFYIDGILKETTTDNTFTGGKIGFGSLNDAAAFDNISLIVPPALPVELLSFTAKNINNIQSELNWSTATEINNDYFNIEKYIDGEEWKTIGKVKGAGNSTRINNYQFFDKNPVDGLNYYRLKQVDFDGSFEYSSIRLVVFNHTLSEVIVYPNPASQYLKVESKDLIGEMIEIINVNGQVVMELQYESFTTNLQITNLPNGTYFLKIGNEVKQLIIAR